MTRFTLFCATLNSLSFLFVNKNLQRRINLIFSFNCTGLCLAVINVCDLTLQMEGGGGGGGGRGRAFGGRRGGRFPWRWMYNKRGNFGGGNRGRGGGKGESESSVEGEKRVFGPEGESGQRGRWRGRGRGYYNTNKRSTNTNNNCNGHSVDGGEDVPSPPRKKQKKTDALQTIKTCVENKWSQMLPGYQMYFPDSPPQLGEIEKKVAAIEAFLIGKGLACDVNSREENENDDLSYFPVCYEDVAKDEDFLRLWPDFNSDLFNDPEETISLWGVAAHKIVYNAVMEQEPNSENSGTGVEPPGKFQIGFVKSEPITPLISIKSSLVGKLVTIRGAIVRSGNLKSCCTRMTYLCKICDAKFAIDQPEGRHTPPTRCKSTDECRNTYLFEPLREASTTIVVESRCIKIQDVQHYDLDRGVVPRTVECVLFGPLADRCSTGDAITLSGIVKMSKDVNSKDQSLHQLYIEVTGIKQHKDSERTMGGHLFSFTNIDYYAIQEIHDTPDLFRLLVASLCPYIYGHELVKAGLLLCLFGGTPRTEGVVNRRSDINMLMVGDPGIGKSQMLKAVSEVAPKAVYICGTGSTVAGLTVTLIRDGDDYSLEAGALVMADKGVCCIDEFDKMSSHHHALLEALEQQSVSIAKSGVFRTLPSRTSVIAAANPVGGHYDNSKTVSENIKINRALMSRFDLIFILLDKPDSEFDQKIVNHIMSGSGGDTSFRKGLSSCSCHSQSSRNTQSQSDESEARQRLIDKVRIIPGETYDLIPHLLLRKYIAYAKQYVQTKLTPEAEEILRKFYLNLRISQRDSDSTPVTARQLESLVRLTEARAKLELREDATADDANDVLEIFEFSLSSAYDSEVLAVSALSESILVQNSGKSRGQSIASQARKLVSALQRCAERLSKNLFSVDEIQQVASSLGIQNSVSSLIATLNNEGFLIKKGGRTYQLQTADY